MAKHTTLPPQTDTAVDHAGGHLPTELPPVQAPPEPPNIDFHQDALTHLTSVPGSLPDWLLP